jgi:hypothetical protein
MKIKLVTVQISGTGKRTDRKMEKTEAIKDYIERLGMIVILTRNTMNCIRMFRIANLSLVPKSTAAKSLWKGHKGRI